MSKMGQELEKRLDEAKYDLYEACVEMMERFNRGTRFPLQSTCDKMNQAIAKVKLPNDELPRHSGGLGTGSSHLDKMLRHNI